MLTYTNPPSKFEWNLNKFTLTLTFIRLKKLNFLTFMRLLYDFLDFHATFMRLSSWLSWFSYNLSNWLSWLLSQLFMHCDNYITIHYKFERRKKKKWWWWWKKTLFSHNNYLYCKTKKKETFRGKKLYYEIFQFAKLFVVNSI